MENLTQKELVEINGGEVTEVTAAVLNGIGWYAHHVWDFFTTSRFN